MNRSIILNLKKKKKNTNDWWLWKMAVKNLPRVLRGILSNHVGDNYCLWYFHLYRTPNILKKHERLCDNHRFCKIEMPFVKNLKYWNTLMEKNH